MKKPNLYPHPIYIPTESVSPPNLAPPHPRCWAGGVRVEGGAGGGSHGGQGGQGGSGGDGGVGVLKRRGGVGWGRVG